MLRPRHEFVPVVVSSLLGLAFFASDAPEGEDASRPKIGLMEGKARISADVLAQYAADAAREVPGVVRLVESHLPRRHGVRVAGEGTELSVELRLAVQWGASIPQVGRAVQQRVVEYLARMADARPAAVDVVVDEIERV